MRFCFEIYFQFVIPELYGAVSWFPTFLLAPMDFAMSSVLMWYLTWTSSYCSLFLSFIISHAVFIFFFFFELKQHLWEHLQNHLGFQNQAFNKIAQLTHLLCLLHFCMPQFPFLPTTSICDSLEPATTASWGSIEVGPHSQE